jgi:hypothetical protein
MDIKCEYWDGGEWKDMSNIDSTDHNIDGILFPNNVTFRTAQDYQRNGYIYICRNCENVGLPWRFTVYKSDFETRTYDNKEYIISNLYKHAELHNPLCRRLENMLLSNSRIYKVEYNGEYLMPPDPKLEWPNYEELVRKSKSKPRRMIRLRYIDDKD